MQILTNQKPTDYEVCCLLLKLEDVSLHIQMGGSLCNPSFEVFSGVFDHYAARHFVYNLQSIRLVVFYILLILK